MDRTKSEDADGKVFVAGLIASEGGSCWKIDSSATKRIVANREILVKLLSIF